MGAALRVEEFEHAFELPRLPDFTAAFAAVEGASEFKKLISDFDVKMRLWRRDMRQKLDQGIVFVRAKSAEHDPEIVASVLVEMLDATISAVNSSAETYSTRIEERPELRAVMLQLGRISGPTARFIRKQFERVETIRQQQLGAIESMRFDLTQFRNEIINDREFHRWSKVSLHRFPVVNEYLGR